MNVPIEFSEDDLCAKFFPHTDALVIAANIQGVGVRRILDNRSSTDLLFASTFDKMGLSKTHLLPPGTPLRGFSEGDIDALGRID